MRPVIGSIAMHALLGVLLAVLHPRAAVRDDVDGALSVELVEAPPPPPLPPAPALVAVRGDDGGSRRAATRARRSREEEDPRGEITIERDVGLRSGADAGSGGTGNGNGAGWGDGLGRGAAGSRALPAAPPVIAQEQRVSKARPARLVYPRRNRDVEEGETFVARVTIDADGYVVGARLVRGFGGRRDEQAASLIFKFRYAPALDEEGRPVRSTLDQNFLVE